MLTEDLTHVNFSVFVYHWWAHIWSGVHSWAHQCETHVDILEWGQWRTTEMTKELGHTHTENLGELGLFILGRWGSGGFLQCVSVPHVSKKGGARLSQWGLVTGQEAMGTDGVTRNSIWA